MARNERLDFLKRKNEGRRLLPTLTEELAAALEVFPASLKFLSLEESDQVRQRAEQSFPQRTQLERRGGDYPFLSKRIPNVERPKTFLAESGADVFLILPEADRVGVLRLSAAAVRKGWGQVLRVKSDGFVLVDATFSNKAVVQVEKDEPTQGEVLDVAVWGTAWSNALRSIPG